MLIYCTSFPRLLLIIKSSANCSSDIQIQQLQALIERATFLFYCLGSQTCMILLVSFFRIIIVISFLIIPIFYKSNNFVGTLSHKENGPNKAQYYLPLPPLLNHSILRKPFHLKHHRKSLSQPSRRGHGKAFFTREIIREMKVRLCI